MLSKLCASFVRPRKQIALGGQLPARRQLVDDLGQKLRQLREKIVFREPGLLREVVDGFGPERPL